MAGDLDNGGRFAIALAGRRAGQGGDAVRSIPRPRGDRLPQSVKLPLIVALALLAWLVVLAPVVLLVRLVG
jgi:hypothetical protein